MKGTREEAVVKRGTAPFLAPRQCLREIRTLTKQAVLHRKEQRRYLVVHEELFYPHMLDQLLADPEELKKTAFEMKSTISGDLNGALLCALLWEDHCEGLLVHLEENLLLCAYYPGITAREAKSERLTVRHLKEIAAQTRKMSVWLDRAFPPGRYSLEEVLKYLSGQMDP